MTAAERPAPLSHLKKLLTHSAVYGAADVFPQMITVLLAPVLTRLLSPAEYGAIALLELFSSVAKQVFRLGLDGAFLRLHYDHPDGVRQRALVGTTALFSALTGTSLFVLVWVGQALLTRALFAAEPAPRVWVLLAALDIYVAAFTFVPQALLRIQDRARLFSGLNLVRQVLNIVLKLLLLWKGYGVTGVLVSDVLATMVFALLLLPTLVRQVTWSLSVPLLRELLGFGLPRVPHGFMLQVQNLADRRILSSFVALSEVGLYGIGYRFGSAVKFALSAFEQAWQPFVYAQIGKPEGRQTLARLATYVLSAFTFVALGVAVLGGDAMRLMTAPAFHSGAVVVPVVALAYLLHGVFLLTSIGIGIEKKARYYPLVTFCSAATNVIGNLLLIPRIGMMGAAWATVASYLVMAAIGVRLSQRLYPLPFETSRLLRLAASAAAVYAASLWVAGPFWLAVFSKSVLLLLFPILLVALVATAEERLRLRSWLRHPRR